MTEALDESLGRGKKSTARKSDILRAYSSKREKLIWNMVGQR